MKKLLALLLALALTVLTGAALADGDLLTEIQSRGYLTIATEGNWSPWTYHDENDCRGPRRGGPVHGSRLGFSARGRGYRPL